MKLPRCFLKHNHEIRSSFPLYPKQLKLNSLLSKLLFCNFATKDLHLIISNKTGKNLSYDVSNLRSQFWSIGKDLTNSELLVKELLEIINTDDCNVHFETDESNVLFLLIQVKMMRVLAEQFSSICFINAMYKVNLEGFPLYTIMCEDCHGTGRLLCYIFEAIERSSTVKPAFKFLEFNSIVSSTCKVIVTDKDLNDIKELFPFATNICIFHVLKYWKLEISHLEISNEDKHIIGVFWNNYYIQILKMYLQNLEKFLSELLRVWKKWASFFV